MKRLTCCVILFALAIGAMAEGTNHIGQFLLTDGVRILPNAAIPTPAEVSAVGASAATAKSGATTAVNSLAVLCSATSNLTDSVSILNGASIMYGACVSFGSQAVESNTNSTSTIVGMEMVSNAVDKTYIDIYTYYDEAPASLPVVEFAESLPGSNASGWAEVVSVSTILTTHVYKGATVECYRNTVAVDAILTSAFFRVKAEGQQTVVGQFLRIYNGITVNGIRGISGVVEGWGTVHDGRLVELVVQTEGDGGETE